MSDDQGWIKATPTRARRAFAVLERIGRAVTPQEIRDPPPMQPGSIVRNNFDHRIGMTRPVHPDITAMDPDLVGVEYWDGPVVFDIVPHWFLEDVLDYVKRG